MAPSVAADITLGTAINFVDVVANIAQLTGVPYAGQVLSLASGILATVQRVRDNSKAFRQLAGDIQDLIVAVVESAGSLSNEMEKSLENLVSVLHNVNDLVSKRRLSHNIIRRALNSVADVSKIHDYRGQIRQALDLFKVKAHIHLHQKVEKISQVLSELRESDVLRHLSCSVASQSADLSWQRSGHCQLPPQLVPPVTEFTLAAVLPDDLLKRVDNDPRLLSILGVAAVFRQRPSVLQISRVLEIEVQAALETISPYLPGRDSAIEWNSDVELPQSLKDSLLQSTGVSAKYHGLVAKWCLVGQTAILDPRDIFYSCDFWEYHVCNADLSTDLFTALRNSTKPLDPGSRDKLPEVIQWLEQSGGPADLVSIYSEANKKPPEPVYGMSSFLL